MEPQVSLPRSLVTEAVSIVKDAEEGDQESTLSAFSSSRCPRDVGCPWSCKWCYDQCRGRQSAGRMQQSEVNSGTLGRMMKVVGDSTRLLSGFCALGGPFLRTCHSFLHGVQTRSFCTTLSKRLLQRSLVTCWLPNQAELDLKFWILVFHGTPDGKKWPTPVLKTHSFLCLPDFLECWRSWGAGRSPGWSLLPYPRWWSSSAASSWTPLKVW